MGKKRFTGDRVAVHTLLSQADGVACTESDLDQSTSRDTLLPLLLQLREFGVLGGDSELEELLSEVGFDMQQALNLYLDRTSVKGARRQAGSRQALQDRAADVDSRDLTGNAAGRGTGSSSRPAGRGYARSRVGESQAPTAAAGNKPPTGSEACGKRGRANSGSLSLTNLKSSVVQESSSRRCSRPQHDGSFRLAEVRVLPIGCEGHSGPCGVHYVSSDGNAVEIDLRTMRQTDPETGISREVRRIKPNDWRVQTDSRKWSRYPNEVCRELDILQLGVEEPARERPQPVKACDVAPVHGEALAEALQLQRSAKPMAMAAEEVSRAKQLAFEACASELRLVRQSVELLRELTHRQNLQCTVADARQAAVLIGSMVLLQVVLLSNPTMQLMGEEVFDQRYPSLKLNTTGRKNTVRALLARGMKLGSHAPSSKLLRKIEADSIPLWEERYLDAMMDAMPELPERVRDHIKSFLSSNARFEAS